MPKIVDLTHRFEDGMPGFRMRDKDGTLTEFTARVRPFLTHDQSRPNYDGKASFEITELTFQTSLGTYLDAPRHRFEGKGDIASLDLASLMLDGIVVDVTRCTPDRPVEPADLPNDFNPTGKAVLFNFGWDRHWGNEQYYRYPYIGRDVLGLLRDRGAGLVGVDALNIDNMNDPERPAHTWFLASGIHIVENLRGLDCLVGKRFRFSAIPLPVKDAAAFPVRAFAEMLE